MIEARKKLLRIMTIGLESAKSTLEDIRDNEQDDLRHMAENLSSANNGDCSNEQLNFLNNAIQNLQDCIHNIASATGEL